tara:strand:- start:2247 stop:3248 length:1002 start_codon:yes stop_codon:yes gene_type:complete
MNKILNYPLVSLVTGVGAIIGQGIVKGIRQSGQDIKIIGIDRKGNSLGRHFCDEFICKPNIDESTSEYKDFWRRVILENAVNIVFPGIEPDVFFFNRHQSLFKDLPVHIVINDKALIEMTSDKWTMWEFLRDRALPAIPSSLSDDWESILSELGRPPFILKPRRGSGSRGVVTIANCFDFGYWKDRLGESWIIQRKVGTNESEFTVGLFGFGDGTALAPIIFRRKLSPAGNTSEATVVMNQFVLEATNALTEVLRPLGPTNYQFRVEDETAFLLEVNPRFSSSNSMRTAVGYNEAAMSIEYFLFGRRPESPVVSEARVCRYSEDHVIYESDNF